MKRLFCLLTLVIAGCGETPPEERITQASAEQTQAQIEQAEISRRNKVNFYRILDQDSVVVCVNGTQYIAWRDLSFTRMQSMVPVIVNGAYRSCTGGITKQM